MRKKNRTLLYFKILVVVKCADMYSVSQKRVNDEYLIKNVHLGIMLNM